MTDRMPEGNTSRPEPEPVTVDETTSTPTDADCWNGWVLMRDGQVIAHLHYNPQTQHWDEIEV
jgi:hypothetical protein